MKLAVKTLALSLALPPYAALAADAEKVFDEISVTATREARSTAEVPQAISVVGKEVLQEKKMFNLKEALQEMPGVLIDSKNGGSDARLIIRGAGAKAAYGIREIMVLRDGVPMSDPDSFAKLDFLDTQDIERIEVAKGPGNLFAAGSAGGAIQIFSKSVFDEKANTAKIGFGNYATQNYHLRYGRMVGEDQALALTVTRREMDNDWRIWNKSDTSQASLKHGFVLAGGDVLESEASYTESNMQLPSAMNNVADANPVKNYMFNRFLATGKQDATSEAWKHSGRYSKIATLNSKLEMERGDFTFKPRIYYNTWYHYHPVTGAINETNDWVWNLGADLEAGYKHAQGTLVGGLTIRQERVPDSRKYQYGSVVTTTSGGNCVNPVGLTKRITATCSDAKGTLAEIDDATTLLTGVYVQESWRPTDRWIVDVGGRYDMIRYDDKNNQIWKYDYANGYYKTGAGETTLSKTFNLFSPKVAVNYKLNGSFHAFAMIAQAGQMPSTSEISSNPALEAPISRNHEIGIKGRGRNWQIDASIYVNPVRNEIVSQLLGGTTTYVNAGKTDKKGLELNGSFGFGRGWEAGGYFAYSDYRYDSFTEVKSGVTYSRAGNRMPFVPKEQYGLFLGWKEGPWRARLSSMSWGEYWLDNANTEKYQGWEWVTNLSVSYQWQAHSLTLNADNLFDKHYAFEVKKDLSTDKVTYTAASPRTVMLTYRYDFR